MQILDAMERFSTQLEADGRSLHTIRQYQRHVRLLSTWLSETGHDGSVTRVEQETVARFLAGPAARTRADGTAKRNSSVNAVRASLRGFFAYLARADLVPSDPTRLVRRARCGVPAPRGLSAEDQHRLMVTLSAATDAAGFRDLALFTLMMRAGIRLGSAISLDVEDLDLEHGSLYLRHAKGDRRDAVILPSDVAEHLREWLADRIAGPVFRGTHGERLSARHVQRRFTGWLRRSGITRHATPHTLRHTFATNLYQKTGDVLLVKDALHHRSIASTLVYARAGEERLRLALGA